MTTLTLPYLVLPLLKLLGRSWFRLDPASPLLPSVEIVRVWVSGLDPIIWAPANNEILSTIHSKWGRGEHVKADGGFD
jgi:hypothetical protein